MKVINFLYLVLVCICVSNYLFDRNVVLADSVDDSVNVGRLEEQFSLDFSVSRIKVFSNNLYIADRSGRVIQYNRETNQQRVVLDISDQVLLEGLTGLLNFEFPPWFSQQPSIYVWYGAPPPPNDPSIGTITTISVFPLDQHSGLADNTKEIKLLEINTATAGHVGGALKFLSDDTLLIGIGEGGGAIPFNTSQRTDTLEGKLLRYNVNRGQIQFDRYHRPLPPPSCRPILTIPRDNPDRNSAFFTTGMRQPYQCNELVSDHLRIRNYQRDNIENHTRSNFENPGHSLHKKSPITLFCYENGGNSWERVEYIEAGDNLGWPCYEGFEKTNYPYCPFPLKDIKSPLLVYPHNSPSIADRPDPWNIVGTSISPGMIYRGNQFPQWKNSLIFGDLANLLLTARRDPQQLDIPYQRQRQQQLGKWMLDGLPIESLDPILAHPGQSIIFVDPDVDGEILVTTYDLSGFTGSRVFKILPAL